MKQPTNQLKPKEKLISQIEQEVYGGGHWNVSMAVAYTVNFLNE